MTIPTKTALGHEELKSRAQKLGQRHRTILFLVDGRRPLAEVLSLAQQAGATTSHFEDLVRLGLVDVPAGSAPGVAPPSPESEPEPEPEAGAVQEVSLEPAGTEAAEAAEPLPVEGAQAPAVPMAASPAEASPVQVAALPLPATQAEHEPAPQPPREPWPQEREPLPQQREPLPQQREPLPDDGRDPAPEPPGEPARAEAPRPPAPARGVPSLDDVVVASPRAHRVLPVLGEDAAVEPLQPVRDLLVETLRFDAPLFSARMFMRVRNAQTSGELIDLVWEIEAHLARARHAQRELRSLQRARELLGLGNTLVADDSTRPPLD